MAGHLLPDLPEVKRKQLLRIKKYYLDEKGNNKFYGNTNVSCFLCYFSSFSHPRASTAHEEM